MRWVNTMSEEVLDEAGVEAKFGVPPERIVDYLSLVGDKVDNIPGVDKCGPKTAAKWLREYGTLEGVIEHAGEIKGKVGDNLRAVRERGMVAVVPDERDGRCVRLHPTDAAAKNLAGHRRRWAACLEAALGGGADVGDCVGLLLRIDEALRAGRGGRADE